MSHSFASAEDNQSLKGRGLSEQAKDQSLLESVKHVPGMQRNDEQRVTSGEYYPQQDIASALSAVFPQSVKEESIEIKENEVFCELPELYHRKEIQDVLQTVSTLGSWSEEDYLECLKRQAECDSLLIFASTVLITPLPLLSYKKCHLDKVKELIESVLRLHPAAFLEQVKQISNSLVLFANAEIQGRSMFERRRSEREKRRHLSIALHLRYWKDLLDIGDLGITEDILFRVEMKCSGVSVESVKKEHENDLFSRIP